MTEATKDSLRRYKIDDHFFDIIGRRQAYYVGLLMADGYVRDAQFEMFISVRDIELLNRMKSDLSSTYQIKTIRRSSKPSIINGRTISADGEFARFRFKSWHIYHTLGRLGIVENKTGKEIFPLECLDYKFDFLRGLFDGDGHVTKTPSGGRFVITSSSYVFLLHLKEIFSIGRIYNETLRGTPIYSWYIQKRDDLNYLFDNLYCNNDEPKLNRKYIKFLSILRKEPKSLLQ